MTVGLVSPYRDVRNPGTQFITAGIKWLLRGVFGDDVEFVPIEMYFDIPEDWDAARKCDLVCICGNPRYIDNPGNDYWDEALWARVASLARAGVPVFDLFAGSGVGEAYARHDIETQAQLILLQPRNRTRLDVARAIGGNVARDAVMQRVYELARIESVLLPCSSWFAAREYGVEAQAKRAGDVAILKEYAGNPPPDIQLVATTREDAAWSSLRGYVPAYITDPLELLRLYARSERVLSYRIHAAIPAASLGAEVSLVTTDNRHLVVAPFEIPAQSFACTDEPVYGFGVAPDESVIVEKLAAVLIESV